MCRSKSLLLCTRGKNREEQETARMGPGAMASKEEQTVKSLNMDNCQPENKEKDEKDQVANKGEPLALALEADLCVPRVNHRWFHARHPIPQYRWDMIQV